MSSSSIMTSASEKTTPPASQPSSIRSVELPTRSPKLNPQNGQPVANGNLNAEGQPKQAEKASVKDRLTRMFSSKGDVPKAAVNGDTLHTQTTSAPSAIAAARAPPQPVRKGSMTTKAAEGAAPATSSKPGQSQRYIINPNVQGGHEHHLKGSKRQEKLSDMWKSLLGRKNEQAPEADLSLVSNWVDTLKQEKDSFAGDRKGGPNATTTLIEKYGKCQEVVGRGAFGIVRISHKKVENGEKLFAVKEFRRRPEETEKKYSKRLTAEFCISSSLRHPNVIHTLDLLKDSKGEYCEVMEFCSGGDLYTLVLAAGKLEVQEADCYFKQMMRGVEYMHEMGVAHRDMKPENLLLTSHGALKITDFGNGECFRMAWENDAHMVSGLCGSAPYIAPEEYIDKEFDARAVDVWACGVIYMAMRTGRHLWRVAKKDEDEFYERYLEGRRDEEGYGPIESLHRVSGIPKENM
jgi:protein-serine/threonine kinase